MLSGTDYDTIALDYLKSYANNNGIDFSKNPEIIENIKSRKIDKFLSGIKAAGANYAETDLTKIAQDYLFYFGMTKKEVQMLQEKLLQ